jgi:NAD-dependent SIR2 family protein deacetylase
MEGIREDSTEGGSTDGFLADVQRFNKASLRPTITHVRYLTAIVGSDVTDNSRKLGFEDEELIEYRDSDEEVQRKVKQLATYIRNARCFVAYTGAGISTSADLADYRGSQGIWTLRDRGLESLADIDLSKKIPTPTHMALVQLQQSGTLKFLVSTNTDGLHIKSGFDPAYLAEMHGNCFIERCSNCEKTYYRKFNVSRQRSDHLTGRFCDDCQGELKDTVVGFGENLPEAAYTSAVKYSKQADVTLVMGTSMRVKPSCDLPYIAKKRGGHMIIVNLQQTPFDDRASLRIGAECDVVMKLLLQELGQDIPQYTATQ